MSELRTSISVPIIQKSEVPSGLRTSILDASMKKGGPESVKRGPERTQDLYFGLYSEKGRS